jgi:hypothetical protein
MSVDLYATKIVGEVLAEHQNLEFAYRNSPDDNLYFMMIDLVQSTNYRLKNGPERGYIRNEYFFTLVRSAMRPYTAITRIKEMGDAVLVSCPRLQPLFESAVLMDHAARKLNSASDDPTIPFAIRMGIDFGVARKLSRRVEDYLGTVIDRLSRIMAAKSERTSLLVEERAFDINRRELEQYAPIAMPSEPISLSLPSSKLVTEPIIYREILLRQATEKPFADYFVEWRRLSPPARHEINNSV